MRYIVFTLFMTTMMPAFADDADALSLADIEPASTTERAKDWRLSMEGAVGAATQRYGFPMLHAQRLSFDVQYDKTFAPGWRVLLSDRLDLTSQDRFGHHTTVNMLKEAYGSWQQSDSQIIDFGRINPRTGVALGYNPTDYFRTGALRSVVSVDPDSLRKNRLGSVMLRGQKLWDGGSVSALYSPKLADHPKSTPFNVDLGATNNTNRWLLSTSKKVSDNFNPQWMIFGETHQSAQLGVNVTRVVTDSIVAYGEWSGGRSRSLQSQILNTPDDRAFRSRLATGLTYTTANKMAFTLEYDYNGAGLGRSDWDALRNGSPLVYSEYRKRVQAISDLVTKQSVFFYSTWTDAMINHLDMTAMLRWNAADHSRISWVEGRYHWNHVDLALQWQRNCGNAGSEFGALYQKAIVQAVATYFY